MENTLPSLDNDLLCSIISAFLICYQFGNHTTLSVDARPPFNLEMKFFNKGGVDKIRALKGGEKEEAEEVLNYNYILKYRNEK